MSDYGERKCLVCGKTFEPQFAQSICCSPECQKKRKQAKKKEWDQRCANLIARVESCEKQIALLERLVKHLHGFEADELERLYEVLLGKPEPEPEPPLMQFCERMDLKVIGEDLPCGKRTECFRPKRCEKVPEGALEVKKNFTPPDFSGGGLTFGSKRHNAGL